MEGNRDLRLTFQPAGQGKRKRASLLGVRALRLLRMNPVEWSNDLQDNAPSRVLAAQGWPPSNQSRGQQEKYACQPFRSARSHHTVGRFEAR